MPRSRRDAAEHAHADRAVQPRRTGSARRSRSAERPASTRRRASLPGRMSRSQTRRILDSFAVMLASVGSDLGHIVHVNIFLLDMATSTR